MPSGPYLIRRPVTLAPLALADTRAGALDVAAREAIERGIGLMVECDGSPVAKITATGAVTILDDGGDELHA